MVQVGRHVAVFSQSDCSFVEGGRKSRLARCLLSYTTTARSRVAGLKCSSVQSLTFGLGEIYACVHPEEAYRYECGQGAGMRAVGGACSMMPHLPLHSCIIFFIFVSIHSREYPRVQG